MKYIFLSLFIITSLFIPSLFLSPQSAHATTGGATLLSHIVFDEAEGTVVYKKHDFSGRGCPPEVLALNIDTKAISTLLSCEDYPTEFFSGGFEGGYDTFSDPFVEGKETIKAIHLRNNNITAQVRLLDEVEFESGIRQHINLQVDIFQNGKLKASLPYTGCEDDQPVLIAGYQIPKSAKSIFLLSHIRDCFEGGYITESLHVVEGIELIDPETKYAFKWYEPASPRPYNIVAYAGDTHTEKESENLATIITLILFLGTLTGFVLGMFFGRKKSVAENTPTEMTIPKKPQA